MHIAADKFEDEFLRAKIELAAQLVVNAAERGETPDRLLNLLRGGLTEIETLYSPTGRELELTSERLAQHSLALLKYRGRQFTGLVQKTIPSLDNATWGLQAMTCLAAGPMSGKTTLVQQVCVDTLRSDPDTCCVIVSLEMSEEVLLNRMKSRVLEMEYQQLLTKNTDQDLEDADRLLYSVAKRLYVIDKAVYPCVTAEQIIAAAKRLKEITGCSHVIIALDYFQIFPIPKAIRKELRTPDDRDLWTVEQMLKIRDAIFPDPFIVISQINKTDKYRAEGMHSVKGSGQITFDADNVWLLNPLTDDQLVESITSDVSVLDRFRLKRPKERKADSARNKEDKRLAAEMLREDMQRKSVDFVELQIAKVRAGTTTKIILKHRHKLSDLQEVTDVGTYIRPPEADTLDPRTMPEPIDFPF
jgi:replicative DNA helicase